MVCTDAVVSLVDALVDDAINLALGFAGTIQEAAGATGRSAAIGGRATGPHAFERASQGTARGFLEDLFASYSGHTTGPRTDAEVVGAGLTLRVDVLYVAARLTCVQCAGQPSAFILGLKITNGTGQAAGLRGVGDALLVITHAPLPGPTAQFRVTQNLGQLLARRVLETTCSEWRIGTLSRTA